MSSSRPVTETVILLLRPDVDLETVYTGRASESGTPTHALTELGKTLKAQDGFIRQFWGTQVENPTTFVWSIDWQSFEHHAAFINSEGYKAFLAGAAQAFDFDAGPPLMMHTAFTSDATACREAPVTEFAYFFIPKDAGEEKKTNLENSLLSVIKAASDSNKCSAFAVGWVFEDQAHPGAPNGQASTFNALLGWPAVEAHSEFLRTSEFKETFSPVNDQILSSLPGREMFHVNLHAVA